MGQTDDVDQSNKGIRLVDDWHFLYEAAGYTRSAEHPAKFPTPTPISIPCYTTKSTSTSRAASSARPTDPSATGRGHRLPAQTAEPRDPGAERALITALVAAALVRQLRVWHGVQGRTSCFLPLLHGHGVEDDGEISLLLTKETTKLSSLLADLNPRREGPQSRGGY